MFGQLLFTVTLALFYTIAETLSPDSVLNADVIVPLKKLSKNGKNGLPVMKEVMEEFRKMYETKEFKKIKHAYRCTLASSYQEPLTESIRKLDDELKIMIAGTNRKMLKVQRESKDPTSIPYATYRSIMMQNVLMREKPKSYIRRSDSKHYRGTSFLKTNGAPDMAKVYQIQSWFENLIGDTDVLNATQINIDDISNFVAETGARVTNFVHAFYQTLFKQKKIVDVGVIRYPDIDNPFFRLFRIELFAFRKCERIIGIQKDESGIKGLYESTKFVPRESILKGMRASSRARAIQEADDMFN